MKRQVRFPAIALVLLISLGLAGCSGPADTVNARSTNADIQKMESENKRLKEELHKTQERLVIKEAEANQLKDAQEVRRKDHNLEAFPERPEDYLYFPVFAPSEKGDLDVLFFTAISSTTTLIEKLESLTGSISRGVFDGYRMEFTGILDLDGKKIAQVDLKDEGRLVWEKTFFPDWEKGERTQSTLAASYLQGSYRMDWIDGVRFSHNGKGLEHIHLPKLQEAIYRNEPANLD